MTEQEETGESLSPATVLELTSWQAKTWGDLKKIWRDLAPEFALAETAVSGSREFRGRILSAQEAGFVFQQWVMEAFRLSGYKVQPAWKVPMLYEGTPREEFDGLVVDGWQGFLVESKFREEKTDFGDIAKFHARINQRPPGTFGLLISAFGFTAPALESATLLTPLCVLLLSAENVTEGVVSKTAWKAMLESSWLDALQYRMPNSKRF
jgi:hypothetical protein